jgi:hypothetical protein
LTGEEARKPVERLPLLAGKAGVYEPDISRDDLEISRRTRLIDRDTNVRRLDISMDNALLVCVLNSVADTSVLANPRMKFANSLFLEQELEVKGFSETILNPHDFKNRK